MKVMLPQNGSFGRRALALFASFLLLAGTLPISLVSAETKPAPRRLSEDQRVVHVLNRLGFGARPGDVERVRKLGVGAYIEQQLNPSKIDDSAAEARLRG